MNIQLKPSDTFDGLVSSVASSIPFYSTQYADAHRRFADCSLYLFLFFRSWIQQDNKNVKENQHAPVGRQLSVSLSSRMSPMRRAPIYPVITVKVCVLIMIFFLLVLFFRLIFCRAQQLRVLNVQDKTEHCMATRSACAECAWCENLRVIEHITIGIIENGKESV